jgi:hypothetical protein
MPALPVLRMLLLPCGPFVLVVSLTGAIWRAVSAVQAAGQCCHPHLRAGCFALMCQVKVLDLKYQISNACLLVQAVQAAGECSHPHLRAGRFV